MKKQERLQKSKNIKQLEKQYRKMIINLADKHTQELITDYLKEFDSILLKHGLEAIQIKKGMDALNKLNYTFYVTSKKDLEELVDEAIKFGQTAKAEGFKNYFQQVIPKFNNIPQLKEPLRVLFGGGFSDAIRKLVEQKRLEEGFDLSKSLWRYTKETQKQIWRTIYDGLQQNKSYSEVRRELTQYLTEKGRANLSYNITRLYRTEVNNAFLTADKYVTQNTDFVEEVHIFRSPNGDPDCEICNEIVGPVGGEGVIVPKNEAEYPSYHPNCMCDYVDVLPSPDDFIDYLKTLGG